MLDLHVIQDAPTTLAEGQASDIQIAKTGTFKDPRYGTFKITSQDFSKWIANFNALNKANDRLGLPIDIDHGPEMRGNTEAAGWLTQLRISAGGNELWARAEWNDLGKELVANKRYAYISPSFVANYKDEHGKEHGTALLGVALTNRPFLSMATVSLSRFNFAAETYTPESNMPYPKPFLDALGLAEDADEATVLAKVAELKTQPEPKTLTELAKAEGAHVLTAEQYASLAQQAKEGAEAAQTLHDQKFEIVWSAALNDTKGARVVPASKELYKGLFEKDADGTIKLMESLPNLVTATPVGSGGDVTTATSLSKDTDGHALADEDTNALAEKAIQLCEADKDLDYGEAVIMAARQLGL
jgi:hypothetical protein